VQKQPLKLAVKLYHISGCRLYKKAGNRQREQWNGCSIGRNNVDIGLMRRLVHRIFKENNWIGLT
jgi:hypothetical protein